MEVDKALYLLTCLLKKHKALGKFYLSLGNDIASRDHEEICEAIQTVANLAEEKSQDTE